MLPVTWLATSPLHGSTRSLVGGGLWKNLSPRSFGRQVSGLPVSYSPPRGFPCFLQGSLPLAGLPAFQLLQLCKCGEGSSGRWVLSAGRRMFIYNVTILIYLLGGINTPAPHN